jgi:hypothetical protein
MRSKMHFSLDLSVGLGRSSKYDLPWHMCCGHHPGIARRTLSCRWGEQTRIRDCSGGHPLDRSVSPLASSLSSCGAALGTRRRLVVSGSRRTNARARSRSTGHLERQKAGRERSREARCELGPLPACAAARHELSTSRCPVVAVNPKRSPPWSCRSAGRGSRLRCRAGSGSWPCRAGRSPRSASRTCRRRSTASCW